MGPTQVLPWILCPLRLPEIFNIAHIFKSAGMCGIPDLSADGGALNYTEGARVLRW